MKSSHKTDTHFYFIIQQLTLNKPFKCDCTGRKKNNGFSTSQKWQIWPNFTIVKTQLVHGISIWNKNCIEAYPLLLFVLKYSWRHSKCTPSRDQNLKGILTPGNRVAVQQITWYRSRSTYWLLVEGSIKAHWLMTAYGLNWKWYTQTFSERRMCSFYTPLSFRK